MRTKTVAVEDRMLDAAARLFGTQRFHEVRMEDIAAEAEVGKGTLYRYFADKEELYVALLRRLSRRFLALLQEALAQANEPRAKLLRVVTAVLAFFDEQPHLFDLIQRSEVLQGPGFVWREARDQFHKLLIGLFEEIKAAGEAAIAEPELTALLLLGGLRAVIRFGQQPRAADLAEKIIDAFLRKAVKPIHVAAGE